LTELFYEDDGIYLLRNSHDHECLALPSALAPRSHAVEGAPRHATQPVRPGSRETADKSPPRALARDGQHPGLRRQQARR
jgi:hypothetical protein